jgi:hypothetical protein
MKQFSYTAVTSSGAAFDIHFPLHAETQSPEAVSDILTRVLAAASDGIGGHPGVSDGDVLQALAMAMAIRARTADARPTASLQLMHALIDQSFAATLGADPYPASRA